MNSNERIISGYLAWLAGGGVAATTVRLRGYLARRFADDRPLATATGADISAYLAALPGGLASRASHLSTIHGVYRWATAAGVLDRDPTALVHSIRVPLGVPHPCPEDVLARALTRADDGQRLALMLGAYAGLRRAEIAALHSDHVSDTHLTITGKGGKTRIIPIHPRLRPLLDFTGYAFPSRGGHVTGETLANRITPLLEGWNCHSLRHRFGTKAFEGCLNIRAVQELMGHASPTTTARYVLVEQDALTAAVLAVA